MQQSSKSSNFKYLTFFQELLKGPARVSRTHKRLADQEGVNPLLSQLGDVAPVPDSAFGNDYLAGRDARQEIPRRLQACHKCPQVAVVDSNQRRCKRGHCSQLALVVNLDQHRHPEALPELLELPQFVNRGSGRDQQDAVGADRARFEHLVRIDDEILAQHRKAASRARRREVLAGALENVLMKRALEDPVLRDRYFQLVLEAVDAASSGNWLLQEITSEYLQIRDAVLGDGLKPYTNEEFEAAFAELASFARTRAAFVTQQVQQIK